MQFKQLLTDNDAVSPVIGVILMVAITVILAAVIGTFVLGLGDQVSDSAPQASFTFEQGTETFDGGGNTADLATVEVTHDGGDAISQSNLDVLVNGNPGVTIVDGGAASADDEGALPFGGSSDITAGSSSDVDAYYTGSNVEGHITGATNISYTSGGDFTGTSPPNYNKLAPDDTIRVVWSSSSGGDTATLGKFTLA